MNVRIRFISVFIIFVALILIFRLYFLQIVNGDIFVARAEGQHINKNTISFDRGEIYFLDKSGNKVPAAISRSGYTVSINPSVINNEKFVYQKLSQIISIDEQDFYKKVSNKKDKNEELVKHLNIETGDKIKKLNLYGVDVSVDKKRFYPGETLASQSIGFVSYIGDSLAGRYGLERYYEDTLKRDPGKIYENFFAEFFSNVKNTLTDNSRQEGDIVTTIEPSIQLFLENELKSIRNTWSSNGAGGIVMDPLTGEILAIAWNPTFNPNNLKEGSVELFGNKMVEGVFEMGSIIKPITMAIGLDMGLVTASTTYYDNGFLVLNNKKISNYDGRGRGLVNMQDVLNQSLNTGVAYVAMKIGNEDFGKKIKSFGLDTETGIDLPNETVGLVENLESNREIEIVTASYGQGIALTPIATVRALSVLANGGKLVVPHLVKKIEYENGLSKKISFAPGKEVIKKETSDEITRMLVRVVDTSLRNGTAKIPGYSVAAKTGTAQMTEEGKPGYVEGKYLHSFFGYFPAYKPKFLVFLFHTYPKNVRYASETLTDPFLNITKFLINYYELPPDRPEEVTTISSI